MAFASQSEIKAISQINDFKPITLPSVEGRKGTGLKLYLDPATTGAGLAAVSTASIRQAQSSTPEDGAAWRFAGVSMKQDRTTA